MSEREWTVVIKGDWYLPHFVNMLREYRGSSEQTSCATDVIAQIEAQMIPLEGDPVIRTTRPLVVIDPEDREQVERLMADYLTRYDGMEAKAQPDEVSYMQAALREFANPSPPKPEGPQGLGAVVEDAYGNRWTRSRRQDHGINWREEWGGHWSTYADLDVVRVLSEGVVES